MTGKHNLIPKDEFLLEHFFELSNDLFCIAGYDGYFKKINPAVSKLLGYSNEELFSNPISTFIHPDDREITSKFRNELKKNNPLLNFENRYVTKSGEIVWLSWTSMPIDNEKLVSSFDPARLVAHTEVVFDSINS